MIGNHVALGEVAATRARVTFAEFNSVDDPMVMAWARFRKPIIDAANAAGAIAGHGPVVGTRHEPGVPRRPVGIWRLLATNNRELGRSFLLYGTFGSARDHLLRLQAVSNELETVIVAGPSNASLGWYIAFEGAPVMTCGRWYNSTSTGLDSAAGAIIAFAGAALTSEPNRIAPSGRFRKRIVQGSHVHAW